MENNGNRISTSQAFVIISQGKFSFDIIPNGVYTNPLIAKLDAMMLNERNEIKHLITYEVKPLSEYIQMLEDESYDQGSKN